MEKEISPNKINRCTSCNTDVSKKNWSRHLQSSKHQEIISNSGIPVTHLDNKNVSKHIPKGQISGRVKCRRIKSKRIPSGKRIKKLSKCKRKQSKKVKIQRSRNLSRISHELPIDPEIFEERKETIPTSSENFEIIETRGKKYNKYETWSIDYSIKIKDGELEDVFDELVTTIKKRTNARNGDKINLIASHPDLHHSISTGLVSLQEHDNVDDNLRVEIRRLVNHVENILSSNEEMEVNDLNIECTFVNMPQGRGRSKIINLSSDKNTKKCINKINNDDNLCCPRAIVTALTYHDPSIFVDLKLTSNPLTENEIAYIRKGRKLQETLAIKLLNLCDIPIPEINLGCSLEDITKIEKRLDIQINIVCAENFNSIIYSGPNKPIKIYLYKDKNHFDVINSMTAFLGSSYYCHKCKTPYQNKDNHKCKDQKDNREYKCYVCNGKTHKPKVIPQGFYYCIACIKIVPNSTNHQCKVDWVKCKICQRYFLNNECFNNHKENKTCQTVWKCNIKKGCKKLLLWKYTTPETHVCDEKLCRNCDKVFPPGHQCYMKRKPAKGGYCIESEMFPCWISKDKKSEYCYSCKTHTEDYLFFDYEAMQETGIHIPNLVVVIDYVGNIEVFLDNDSFCKWLINKKHRNYTAIAHNAKGYDTQFILQYCVENTLKPYTIYNGTKLNLLQIPGINLRIIDSMNFIQGPLSSFPKTFGLKELKKGYFPHFFNKVCNQNYVGPIPSKRRYGYMQMKTKKDKETFEDWYKIRRNATDKGKMSELIKVFKSQSDSYELLLNWHNNNIINNHVDEKFQIYTNSDPKRKRWYEENWKCGYIFDFKKELLEYCKSDVDILRRGCISLREEFLEIANIDPFQYLTIASVTMAIFRSKYLKENTIAVIEEVNEDTYSKESICWLDYMSVSECVNASKHQNPNLMQHALNGGEKIILGHKVDGYCKETNTVYQFHGCFWHGCPKCFDPNRINNKNQKEMKDLYIKTQERNDKIREKYNLIEIWECDWTMVKKNDRNIKDFIRNWNREIITPLNPRDALFGGRTNATKLLYDCKNVPQLDKKTHKIRYIDVCSLYPTVMFYDYYPVGHPIKKFNPKKYNPDWYGLIKCKVLPPRKLYHPVLPIKIEMGKSEKLLFPLCHTCAKNQISRCNHTNEEREFIGTWATDEVNKAIEKGYKIKNIYEVWHFEEKSNDLFKDYIKDFMKIKLETSPWQDDFKTIEEYTNSVKDKLDITLENDKVIDNPGKRAVAKACLNNFWGKFGQRIIKSETKYVSKIQQYYAILLDDRIDIKSLNFLNEKMVQMTYDIKNQFIKNQYNTNEYVAIWTTSNARLRLYEKLDYLGELVIYFDTDSIFYIDDGTKNVKTGCLLGDWTDELKGNYINLWGSTGPKSYGYIDNEGSEKCKIKGFYLNYENSLFLNYKSMCQMIKKEIKDITIVEESKITRDPKSKNIVSKYQEKIFSFDYDKRVINKINEYHIDTLPYGY